MDDFLLISYLQHESLQNQKPDLESRYHVKINVPEVKKSEKHSSDEILCVTISGDVNNVNNAKDFLARKVDIVKKQRNLNEESVIILSSESEAENHEDVKLNQKRKKRKRRRTQGKIPKLSVESSLTINENSSSQKEVTNANDSVIILESTIAEDFIPISSNQTNININKADSLDIIEISSDEETTSIPPAPRQLRPVAIDGSNVARAHGGQNTFSCKGIKIAVDYFLNRGHTQVIAFVPQYRKFCKSGNVITTDQHILEELEQSRNIVFTPGRRINGKSFSCYDDRFIVQYAAANNGVILSNDNYKDLIDENPSYRETIENRLLLFCFAGDMLMIAEDPLGVRGPKLKEILSFPPSTV